MGTRCTLLLRNRGAGSKYTDLKNRPKMPSQGSERPSFGRFLGSSTQCRRCHYFHARICAHAAHAFAEYTR